MNRLFLLIFGVIAPLCIQNLEAGKTKTWESEDAKEFVQPFYRKGVSKTSIKKESYQNLHSKVAGKNPKEISVSTNIPNEETAESIPQTKAPKTTDLNTAEILSQQKELIETLKKSLLYLDKLVEIIQPMAIKYRNKADNNPIGVKLIWLGVKIMATKNSIHNCICFLNLKGGEVLGSLSAEDMSNWVNTINAQLKELKRELNERKILNINIEDHGIFIQTSAKKLQALWKVNTKK